jgi:hypothetical protein
MIPDAYFGKRVVVHAKGLEAYLGTLARLVAARGDENTHEWVVVTGEGAASPWLVRVSEIVAVKVVA